MLVCDDDSIVYTYIVYRMLALDGELFRSALQVPVSVSSLSGRELAQLCYAKYGRFHDMAIRHVTLNRGKTQRWVSLNLYVGFYGQKSFPYDEEEYLEKLDAIAVMINAWQQVRWVMGGGKV